MAAAAAAIATTINRMMIRRVEPMPAIT